MAARKPEQLTYDSLKNANKLGALKIRRLENAVSDGDPDTYGINKKGVMFWLELKSLKEWPKRASTCPLKGKLQPTQYPWHVEWRRFNGWSFWLFDVKETGEVFIIPHEKFEDIRDMTQEEIRNKNKAEDLTMASVVDYLVNLEHRAI
jgi:hypothetical protein